MMQNNQSIRGLAILTGSVLAASALVTPAPAKADKADKIKIGATILGAAAVVLGVKGKTVPAVIAAAAGAYAYKKGRDEDRKKNDYPAYGTPSYGQYPQYPGNNYPTSGNNYPTSGNYPTYDNSPTYGSNYPSYNNSSNSYPTYNQPTTYSNYPSGGYDSNNNCHEGNRNTGSNTGNRNGGYNGGYNGNYNNGSDRYPNSSRAVVPQSAAPAPRSNYNGANQNGANQNVVLR